jgi:hypothetical protein
MAQAVRVPAGMLAADALAIGIVPIQNGKIGILANVPRALMLRDVCGGDVGLLRAATFEILVLVVVERDVRVAIDIANVPLTSIVPTRMDAADALLFHRVIIQDGVLGICAVVALAEVREVFGNCSAQRHNRGQGQR